MRGGLVLLLLALGVYLYAERRGLALGYPPFLPVLYWKYTGEARYGLRVTGVQDAIKVRLQGELREGRLHLALRREGGAQALERTYSGRFQDEVRYPAEPGAYQLVLRLEGAKGWARYDWVGTRFAP